MRDARPGGGPSKPQVISEHGAGQQANKKPRPFHAQALKAPKPQRGQALKQADKQHRVQQIVDSYASDPRGNAKKLRDLGMSADFIRAVHKSAVKDKRTEPAPGAGGRLLHALDTAGEYTVGLGMVRPSHAPGNALAKIGIHTHLPQDKQQHPSGPAKLASTPPSIGIVPFVPGGASIRPAAWDKGGGGIPKGPGMPKTNADLNKIAEKQGATHIERGRTPDEARARLKKLDAQYEKMVKNVTEATQGKPSDFADVTRRRNMRAKKRANRGLQPLPTVSSEMRSRAEAHLAKASEGDSPEAKRLKAFLKEREDLRSALNENALPLGGEATSLGTTKQTMKFPGGVPEHVQHAAGRLASMLDKESVRKLRAEQERLHTEERAKRARVAHAALLKHAGTEKAIRIAKSKLAGELPKVPVTKILGDMSAEDVNTLRHYIHTNDRIPFFDKINAETALEKGLTGHPLTEGERTLLHKTFGKEFATRIEMPSLGTRIGRVAGDLANLPRSVESAFDLSAPGRQGLVALARHPVISAKNFGPMAKAFVKEGEHVKRVAEIEHRPNYNLYRRAKLALTDVGETPGPREEFYPSHIGDKIPGVKQSGRAYTDYLMHTRADVFDKQTELARKAGVDTNDQHFLESLGRFVNSATGRGDLGSLNNAGKVVNAALFSPRLLKSRLDFLNPVFYAKLHPQVRKEAFRSALQTIAFGVSILELASKAGAGVELDPRSSDFGKIRFGDTRIDIWGGFQPVVRTIAQLATGERKATTTGDILKLDGKFGHSSRLDVGLNFLEGKAAPLPSVGLDILRHKTFVGQPVTLKGEAFQRGLPFAVQDALDVHHGGHSVPESIGAYGLSAVGVGVQNYSNDPAKVAKETHNALSTAFEQNLRRYYKIGLTPQIKKALRLREARAVYLAKHPTHNPLDRYNAQIDLAAKMKLITPKQAHGAKDWASKQDEHKLKSASTALGREYFGGSVLEAAAKQIRDKGGKFYLGDKSTWKP